ncbi:hypothetical protein CXB35_27525 [Pseudomonas syringae]|nr:hypothetical protein CXB35_27525 [Pseudomonas syringae]
MHLLRICRSLNLKSWCIGAGVIRNMVWDMLHDAPYRGASDLDLVFFDKILDPSYDKLITDKISKLYTSVRWDVTNQAHVHVWYGDLHQTSVRPYQSLEEAISTWPEYCTSVGISLQANDDICIYAPFGLEDLFSLTVRHNPARASREVFENRVETKFCIARWPNLKIFV